MKGSMKTYLFVASMLITGGITLNIKQGEGTPILLQTNLNQAINNDINTPTTKNDVNGIPVFPTEDCKIDDYHQPWGSKIYENMRNLAVLSLVIVATALVIIKNIVSFTRSAMASFMKKCFQTLIEESFLMLLFISILSILYMSSGIDDLKLNWQYVILGLFGFSLTWFVFSSLIIIVTYLVVFKWFELEANSKSFKSIKAKYENNLRIDEQEILRGSTQNDAQNNQLKKKISTGYFQELYEFLILKTYFIVPFYPLFKPGTIRKNFPLSKYLSNCIVEKLEHLFRVSWTSYIFCFTFLVIWASFVHDSDQNFQLIFMYCYPLIGLMAIILIYIYMRVIYRRVIWTITSKNYMEFKDLELYNQNHATGNFLNYPVYLDNVMNNEEESKNSKINFHRNLHNRPSTFYEDLILFGTSGPAIFLNIIQTSIIVFALWFVLMIVKLIPIFDGSTQNSDAVIIIGYTISGLYIIIYSYLTAITLRWFTVVTSIETLKNEKCLLKTINDQTQEAANMSELIFKSFKRLYFDMRIKGDTSRSNSVIQRQGTYDNYKSRFNLLNKPLLQKFVSKIVLKFKRVEIDGNAELEKDIISEDIKININNELKLFLSTSGNSMTEDEIDFMVHMIEEFEKYSTSKEITLKQFQEIWAVTINFSLLRPEEVFQYVFARYFEDRPELENNNILTDSSIIEFFRWYQEYFSQEQIDYVESELSYLGKEISIDAFITTIVTARQYYAN